MPLGEGYFYDRKRRRYISIQEHATDAVTRPEVFKSHKVKHLDPVSDRDIIVIHVLRQGFIRVRHWKQHLGWQFWGAPKTSLEVLRRYIKKHDVGDGCIITFTDFATRKQSICQASEFKKKEFLNEFTSQP